jgi:hypothetical protein
MTEASKNLTVARGERSVWDQPRFRSLADRHDGTRLMTGVWGTSLLLLAARKRTFASGLVGSLGGVVALRAALGYHDYAVARGWLDRYLRRAGWRVADIVDDTSEDSFPASDPPQWTTATTATPNRG